MKKDAGASNGTLPEWFAECYRAYSFVDKFLELEEGSVLMLTAIVIP